MIIRHKYVFSIQLQLLFRLTSNKWPGKNWAFGWRALQYNADGHILDSSGSGRVEIICFLMVSMASSLRIDGGNKWLQKSMLVMYKHRHRVTSRLCTCYSTEMQETVSVTRQDGFVSSEDKERRGSAATQWSQWDAGRTFPSPWAMKHVQMWGWAIHWKLTFFPLSDWDRDPSEKWNWLILFISENDQVLIIYFH